MSAVEAGLCVEMDIKWHDHESLYIFSLYTWTLSDTDIAQVQVENGSILRPLSEISQKVAKYGGCNYKLQTGRMLTFNSS